MRLSAILLFLILSTISFSQSVNPDFFNKIIFFSDFSSAKDSKTWPSINNSDELILINSGEYIIDRRSPVTDRMLFPDYMNPFINYELFVGLSLESLTENEQYVGVCFSFSYNYNQGYIIEFNKKKQFRIRKIDNGTVTYITGKNESQSWIKNNMLMLKEGVNDISIRVMDNLNEVYINNFLAYSFTVDNKYEFRNFGLFTTKATKAVFYRIQLKVNENEIPKYAPLITRIEDDKYKPLQSEEERNSKNEEVPDNNVKEVKAEDGKSVDLVMNLNNQIKQLQKSLDEQKMLLERCKGDNIQLDDYIKKNVDTKLQTRAIELEKENNRLKDELSKLRTENTTLQDFKTYYQKQNKDKDIVNFLYDELKKLEEKNAFLNRQLEQLQEQGTKKPKK